MCSLVCFSLLYAVTSGVIIRTTLHLLGKNLSSSCYTQIFIDIKHNQGDSVPRLSANVKTDATTCTRKFRRLITHDFWGGQGMPLKLGLKYHERAGKGVRLGNFVIAVVWGSPPVQYRMTSNLWPFYLSLLSTGIIGISYYASLPLCGSGSSHWNNHRLS